MGLGRKLLMGSALVGSLFLNNCEYPWDPVSQSGELGDYTEKENSGNVSGTVRWDPDKDGDYTGVSGAYVMLLEGTTIRKDTKTGSGGSFSFNGVPEGNYKIEAQISPSNIPDLFCSGSTIASVTKQETTKANIKMSCN